MTELKIEQRPEPCPLCGTEMVKHEFCISHPKPKRGDCLLRYYSFGIPSLGETMDEVIAAWNTRAEQSLRPTAPDAVRERVRHKVRGTEYAVIGIAEVQTNHAIHEGVSLVVYQGDNGKLWCRPKPEFYDGRFEPLTKELSDADVAVDEATVERVRDAIRDHMNAHGPICTDNLAKAALAAMGAKP